MNKTAKNILWLAGTAAFCWAALLAFTRWASPGRESQYQGQAQIAESQFAAVAAGVDPARLRATVESLAAKGSRLSGSPGAAAAAAELSRELASILGRENVSSESFDVDNPFDLGSALELPGRPRVYPFWHPSLGSYQLPASGLELGPAAHVPFSALMSGRSFRGQAVITSLPAAPEMRALARAAFAAGEFKAGMLTQAERQLLEALVAGGRAEQGSEEEQSLGAVAAKSQLLLADFAFRHWAGTGLRSLWFRMPAGMKGVPVHSFEDRLLKHPSQLPRYLLPAGVEPPAGQAMRLRQAHSELRVAGGAPLRVHPFWPNGVRSASTPPGGLEGPLLWAGGGGLEEIKGKRVQGSLALVDFNCGMRWVSLADLGAKAILFVEPKEILRGEAETKYLSVPADIPRFWISRADAAALRAAEGKKARLDAQVVWERKPSLNLVGRLAGTQEGGWEEPVVLLAHYDSVSVVPDMAPGAEQACGAAALLELARVLKKHPLKKPVLFVLASGHSQAILGWREFLYRHSVIKDKGQEGRVHPAFTVDLDLSTRTSRLGIFFKADLYNVLPDIFRPTYANFAADHAAACRAAAKALGYGEDFVVDSVNPEGGQRWHDAMPGRFALAQEVTQHAGLHGLGYATAGDERILVDTPQDLPASVDFGSLARQVRVLACALPNVLNVGGPFAGSKLERFWVSIKARVVEFDPRVSYLPDRTVDGSLVWVHSKTPNKSLKGVRGDHFVSARGRGEQGGAFFEVHGFPNFDWQASGEATGFARCEAFELDPLSGAIRYAPDEGSQGAEAYAREGGIRSLRTGGARMNPDKEFILVTFPGKPLLFFDLVDPLNYKEFSSMTVLDARTDSPPLVYGRAMPMPAQDSSYAEPLAMAFAPAGSRVKAAFWAGALGRRGALVAADKDAPEGRGFAVDETDRVLLTSRAMAADLCALNGHRLGRMRRHGIVNRHLDQLQEEAEAHLKAADEAAAALDHRTALSESRAAWGLAARVYPDVRATAGDVVQSAMLFLALLIPFAFLAERLLLGYPEASQRTAAGTGIFLAAFLVLRLVHPAFQISLTPLMILLSFVIISLSVILSSLVASRFFDFLKESREEMQGVHRSEVSRVSLALAAFSIGVSNMRKRPLRTFLTCLTVVVLTFAVLSLTSVLQALKQRRFALDEPARYAGLLFRDPKWEPLKETALGHLRAELAREGRAVPRAWLNSDPAQDRSGLELASGPTRAMALAALGVMPEEKDVSGLDKTLLSGSWFASEEAFEIILSDNLAKALKLPEQAQGARLELFGVPFTVKGVFSSKAFSKVKDLDGEDMSPANFDATRQRDAAQSTGAPAEEGGGLPRPYLHHDAGQLALIPYGALMKLGGKLASVAVPLRDPERVQPVVGQLLSRLGLLVYVGREGRTFAYSAVGGTATGGLDGLLVPVLIAALIIFSTMFGAVQERKREIAVFSSVGLAPSHVAVLFLAEACVYAILGAAVGYLIGQGFSHLITQGIVLKGLNVNYSSSAAIMAMLVVMAVVLLSTLYPALLAGRLARPAQAPDFVLPPNPGERVSLELPFSFNARDAQAVGAFLEEYFQAHAEASAGEFSTQGVALKEDGKGWVLAARVWLAPYDFGVSQELAFRLAEGSGSVSSARLEIRRLSGDQDSWRRVNTRFLKDVRKQFLIWRSLGEGARLGYFKASQALLAKKDNLLLLEGGLAQA